MSFLLIDLKSLQLDAEEKELLAHPAIAGVILFSRNYSHPTQLRALTRDIRAVNPGLFIVADQEGGRVQRFRERFTCLPSMRTWRDHYQANPQTALKQLTQAIATMVIELKTVGVQASLMPVLDLDYALNDVIADRSLGQHEAEVTELALQIINVMHRYGMPTTGKHFPGHGAVQLDSHITLPVDERPFNEMLSSDIMPYQCLINDLNAIMPAHVIYPAVDRHQPAGFSRRWLKEILREKLNFKGLIISDCITMKATESFGDYEQRTRLALDAGCDLVTLCNNRSGVYRVLDQLGSYQCSQSEQRLASFANLL
jgi:beta-N-acetylhexosaminidase